MGNNIDRLYNNIEHLISENRLKEVFMTISKELEFMEESGMVVSLNYLNNVIEEEYYENHD